MIEVDDISMLRLTSAFVIFVSFVVATFRSAKLEVS